MSGMTPPMKPCKLGCLPILTYSLPSLHAYIHTCSLHVSQTEFGFHYLDLCISPSILFKKIHLENEGSSQQHGVSRGGCLPAPVHWLAAILSDLPLDIATPDRLAKMCHESSREIRIWQKRGILGMYDLKTILPFFLLEAISCFSFTSQNSGTPFRFHSRFTSTY